MTQRPQHGGNLVWAASLAGCPPQCLLDFSASINPLGPPVSVLSAIQESLGAIAHYPDPSYRALRRALAQQHNLSPDWILPGNGAAELLTLVGQDLAQNYEQVYAITPAFGDYRRAVAGAKGQFRSLPLLELQALMPQQCLPLASAPLTWTLVPPQQALAIPAARASVIFNTPHNPTGGLLAVEQIRPYLEADCGVAVDEAFIDFLPPPQQRSLIPLVEQYPNLVVLRSLTKFYSLPGLRLGYAVAHPERLSEWQQWRDPWSVNVLAEAAGLAALSDHAFQQKTWDWLPIARRYLFEGLDNLPGFYPYPGVANFLLVRSDVSVIALQQALLQDHQILIRDCLSFPELGDRFFRVAVRTEAENQRLLSGLASVLKSLSP